MKSKDKKAASSNESVSTPYLQAVRNNGILAASLMVTVLGLIGSQFAWAYYYANKPPIKEPVFIEYLNGTNNFVRITKAGEDIPSRAAVIDQAIRAHVVDRETVDGITESVRYPRVVAASSKAVGRMFKNKYVLNDPMYKIKGFSRTVDVLRSGLLDEGVYQVDIKVTDKQDDAVMKPKFYVVNIAFSLQEQKVTFDEQYMNPVGLYVEKYAITERSM